MHPLDVVKGGNMMKQWVGWRWGKKNNFTDRIMRQAEKKERTECTEVRKRHVEITRAGDAFR